jgi:hypothetical protein
MRRLNVQFSQIEECIRTSLFAVDTLPRNPPLKTGEPLLLQLTKADAARLGKLDRRIEFALLFESVVSDHSGAFSREHWPSAGKEWKYILRCSETIPTLPFSLDRLGLARDYSGQTNAHYIEPEDEAKVLPYLKGYAHPAELPHFASVHDLLAGIRNYDTVMHLAPVRSTRVQEHQRRLRDPWLGEALKALYEHRCQICLHDFKPRYGVPYADTRFLTPLEQGGEPVSKNLVVLCPNHEAIIGAAEPTFDVSSLSFRFPNGLVEKFTLRDHLVA